MSRSEMSPRFNEQDLESIDGDFLVDVLPSDVSTRMPIPEKTYYQELLDRPVPLENRIAHLIPYIEPIAQKYTADAIGTILGVDAGWVQKNAQLIGITVGTETKANGETRKEYPNFTLEILKEELDWARAYRELDSLLSSYAIGQFLAHHPDWVESMAAELEVYHTPKMRLGSGAMGYGYPKSLIPQLRHLILLTPPAEDKLTLDALSEITGRKKEWIGRRLDERGIEHDQRRSLARGAMARHYPWESLGVIQGIIESEPAPAGNWMTIGTMARRIGKDYEWVKARVQERYIDKGELRLDDDHKARIHYPPEVFEALQKEAQELEAYEVAGIKDLALYALAKRLGHDQKWVVARLPYTTIAPRTKLNPANNRLLSYYPDEAEEIFRNLPADILKTPLPSKGDTDQE